MHLLLGQTLWCYLPLVWRACHSCRHIRWELSSELTTNLRNSFAHVPQWFATYNYLKDVLPPGETLFTSLLRQAFVGFVASVVSDTISNSLRVVKTYRQVNDTRIGYLAAAREVVRTDGLLGLFGRGLKTRIISNGLQGLMFSVLWKLLLDL